MMTFPTIAAGTRANEAIGGYANFVAYCNALAAGVDSVTTTAAGAALKANNLSDLASASTARTNLGLGTMATASAADYLTKAGNLAGLADLPTARTNLGLGTMATATATDYLTKAGNLAGLADLPTARTNLGLGTMATATASDYLSKAGNLSGIADPAAARTNLSLGDAATRDVGTTAGTVAAGDDSRLTGALQASGNLAAIADAAVARTNLGLGTMATAAASDYLSKAGNLSGIADPAAARTNLSLGDAATRDVGTGAGTVAAGDDSRLSDARTPTAHTHPQSDVDGLVDSLAKKAPRTALWLPGVSGNYASAPYVAAMGITGDLEVTAHAAPTDWTPAAWLTFAGRYISSADQRCWRFTLETNGKISLEWSTNGTGAATVTAISSTAPTVTNGDDLWVRATLDVDNGAGGYEVKFYTSSDGTTWTQLGTTVTGGSTTSVFSSASAALEVGGSINGMFGPFAGDLYSVEVRNGIGGTVVASPDFTAPNGPRHRDAQGNIWTINGSAWAWELA